MAGTSTSPTLPVGRLALFLDVDGTLIDLASRPDAVVVPSDLIQTLATLDMQLGGALALVSGRPIADLDALFRPLRLRASGVHGAEVRDAPDALTATRDSMRLPDAVIDAVRRIAAAHDRTLVEDKGFSVALHYRADPAAGPRLRDALDRLAAESDLDLQVLPGHMVFEVKRTAFNKGLAIAAFMREPPFAGRRPVFLGDDVTDLPGFETVLGLGGLAFSVMTPRPGLSGHFASPGRVRDWLAALAGHRR